MMVATILNVLQLGKMMIDWIKNEYRRFKESRTVKLAYAQSLLGVLAVVLELMPFTKDLMSPTVYGVIFAVFGLIAKRLRLATSTSLK